MTEPLEPLDRQRIAVYEPGDGSWVIARAGPICPTCADCGCGDPLDPITIPAMFVNILRARQEGKVPKLGELRKLVGMMGNGGNEPG
jgi:hypothetical protein